MSRNFDQKNFLIIVIIRHNFKIVEQYFFTKAINQRFLSVDCLKNDTFSELFVNILDSFHETHIIAMDSFLMSQSFIERKQLNKNIFCFFLHFKWAL